MPNLWLSPTHILKNAQHHSKSRTLTRLADSGTQKEENCSFYWKWKGQDEARVHGVGFAVSNKLLSMIEERTGGSDRLLTLKLHTADGHTHLICAYAPTNCSDAETKNCFYEKLNETIYINWQGTGTTGGIQCQSWWWPWVMECLFGSVWYRQDERQRAETVGAVHHAQNENHENNV